MKAVNLISLHELGYVDLRIRADALLLENPLRHRYYMRLGSDISRESFDQFVIGFHEKIGSDPSKGIDLVDDTRNVRLFCNDLFGKWSGFFKQLMSENVRLLVRISSEEDELNFGFLEFYHQAEMQQYEERIMVCSSMSEAEKYLDSQQKMPYSTAVHF
jgi:hypothetical protein